MTYAPSPSPARTHPIGCCSGFVVLAGIAVCLWLTSVTGFGNAFWHNASLLSIPVPSQFSLVLARLKPSPAESSFAILGKPSVSAAFINQVLAQAHSPAAGTGQRLYDLSLSSGIDDVYPLAFFQHESVFGTTGIAQVTRSLGNIRCSQGYVCMQGFRAYPTWQAGYADWYHLIRTLYVDQWHLLTIAQIVPVYAPKVDHNDPAAYISAIENDVTRWRGGQL